MTTPRAARLCQLLALADCAVGPEGVALRVEQRVLFADTVDHTLRALMESTGALRRREDGAGVVWEGPGLGAMRWSALAKEAVKWLPGGENGENATAPKGDANANANDDFRRKVGGLTEEVGFFSELAREGGARAEAKRCAPLDWSAHGRLLSTLRVHALGYYHWTVEVLPQLAAFAEWLLLEENLDVQLLLYDRPFILDSVLALGIARERIVTYDADLLYYADQLLLFAPGAVVPLHPPNALLRAARTATVGVLPPAPLMLPHPEAMVEQSSTSKQNGAEGNAPKSGEEDGEDKREANEEKRPSILLAARDEAPPAGADERFSARRRLLNAGAVQKALARALGDAADVVPFRADKLSLDEQRKLFAGAAAVVGPHGAALANSLYMAPRAVVVEIVPERCAGSVCFALVCGSLGLRHHRIVCPGAGWAGNLQCDAQTVARVALSALVPSHPMAPQSKAEAMQLLFGDDEQSAREAVAARRRADDEVEQLRVKVLALEKEIADERERAMARTNALAGELAKMDT